MKKIGLIFPGQGSQYVGMGQDLYDHFPIARETFAEAEEALGFDIASLCFNGPEDKLKLTAITQPAVLTVSVAIWRIMKSEADLKPIGGAGHSLGEYGALVAAGAVPFAEAVRLVHWRGKFMQEAVPVGVGAMAAVLKVPAQTLQELTAGIAGVEVANYNSPEQTVISGTAEGVARATEVLKGHRARVVALPVSAPFHSSLMRPARDRLHADLFEVDLHPPRFPVYSNVLAQPETRPALIRELLLEQITHAVRWVEILQHLKERGVKTYLEFGSGKVLTGLVARTLEGVEARSLTNPSEIAEHLAVVG